MYCEAAWDSFLCWPPAAPGETLMRPCPMLDSMGSIIGESTHPGGSSPGFLLLNMICSTNNPKTLLRREYYSFIAIRLTVCSSYGGIHILHA
ncbi:hypothetical protein CEXT_738251 [Caerostris extrusa]|uniref:G-protein coupled receptors family 2 profile 1 domain-containing protein n=1 Tax=Caerostris extrusa TaxID=172846 RepID=A0AAV4NH25_CAEEX|nr:hypothetical protein CEXT_738251 [Caerostris extrusa]